jgi:chromosome segregation ATPase
MTRTDTLYERLLEENPGNLIYLEEMLHHARQMEGKLDEAREDLEFRRGLYKVQEQCLETARRERDEARAELSLKCQSVTIASGTISDLLKKSERLEKQIEGLNNFANERFDEIQRVRRERDEARAELREWQTLCLWGGTLEHIHDFIRGQQTRIHEAQNIEKTCEQLERERDEARQAFVIATDQMVIAQSNLREANKERDEAREERDNLKQELEIVTARLHGKKHPLDNGIPERHEVYIFKNGKYELDT